MENFVVFVRMLVLLLILKGEDALIDEDAGLQWQEEGLQMSARHIYSA
ncbi:hypothetical protein ACO0K9_24890 [Undibacterium sp. Ji50W]